MKHEQLTNKNFVENQISVFKFDDSLTSLSMMSFQFIQSCFTTPATPVSLKYLETIKNLHKLNEFKSQLIRFDEL